MKKGKKIKNLKKDMEKLKYEINDSRILQTYCPYDITLLGTEKITKVGSYVCTRCCKHFVSDNKTKQVVECSYKKNNK